MMIVNVGVQTLISVIWFIMHIFAFFSVIINVIFHTQKSIIFHGDMQTHTIRQYVLSARFIVINEVHYLNIFTHLSLDQYTSLTYR